MFGHRGGTGKGVTSTFPVKFHTLWTRKLLKSDQIISLTVINKTTVWGKMCDQNPQRGDKKSVQMPHICLYPPSSSSKHCIPA